MRIVVLGATGMLGKRLVQAGTAAGIEITALQHRYVDIGNRDHAAYVLAANNPDVVINAAGVRTESLRDVTEMTRTNAIGPHLLAAACVAQAVRLIHVSTDCVFSGALPPGINYSPEMMRCPVDNYGWSKALGEPEGSGVTVVRTSFMGPEHGLWGWASSRHGTAPGWTQAYWSGSTVYAVAKALIDIARAPTRTGTFHLATEEPISKYHALNTMNMLLKLGLTVEAVDEPRINRGLDHSRNLCLPLPPFAEALEAYVLATKQER